MSIKNINKIIMVQDALTGEIIFTINYEDYLYDNNAYLYTNNKIRELQEDERGAIVKIGYKNT